MSEAVRTGFRRVRMSSDDGVDYDAVFRGEYAGSDLTSTADPDAPYEYTVAGDDDVSFRTMHAAGGPRGGTIGPRRDHVVFWLSGGALELQIDGDVRVITPGAPTIVSASVAYRFAAEETHYNGLHISDTFLRTVGHDLGIRMPQGPVLFDQQDDRIVALAPLRSLMRRIGPQFVDPVTAEAVRESLKREIVGVVLETFPMRLTAGSAASTDRLTAAVAFIEEHADERIQLADIVEAAGMSARGLQQLFARTLSTSPMGHLADVRFERVRRALLAADPRTGRVGTIARAAAFGNLGRFAGAYQERFGESPAATLRRSP
ncbi:helix-turn-helix domain-containing protein [Curtobacterium sp. RRHDQ10]|uniref:AraC family transcriptional regulator n=1 Tax=Curtobacterium phyllosphaerae TaxID=3413379 RepID=UPI003BF0D8BF